MIAPKAVILLVILKCIAHGQALNSLQNYGNSVYPGRCVVELGSSVALLSFGESVKLDYLPCTQIYCFGDGWGMLKTCDYQKATEGCRLKQFNNWMEDYPKCCERQMACD